jgi:preprotein translocase subunit Sec63
MGFMDGIDDWFKSWIGKSERFSKDTLRRKIEEEEKPKHKPKPSPKTKSSEEIFKDFEWYKGPVYKNKVDAPPKVYVDPNLLEGYRIFCIDETASKEDIKSRFHGLAKKYHPDHNKSPHAAQSFINLKKWYEYLLKHHVQKESK